MNTKKIQKIAKIIGIVTLLAFLFFKTMGINLQHHNKVVHLVRQSKSLDVLVNDTITKLRFGVINNYDVLTQHWSSLKQKQEELDNSLTEKNLNKYWEVYKQGVLEKENLIEEFKISNSYFNNSISHFPLLTTRLIKTLPNLEKGLNRLLRLVLLYNSTTNHHLKAEIFAMVKILQKKTSSKYAKKIANKLQAILAHAQIIANNKESMDRIVFNLTSFPLKNDLDTFSEKYDRHYNAKLQNANKYRLLLYLLCIFLIFYVAYIIFELKTQKKALAEVNKQLEEASRHKSEFLANMSHELRTPINAIIGYTSLTLNALKESISAEYQQNLGRVEQAARTLLHLINDILDFSKIEAGKIDFLIEKFDLEEVLDECIATAEGLLLNKTVFFKEEIAENLPIIESDFTKIKQILINLLSNAIKFTEKGSVSLIVEVFNEKKIVCIKVQDTGCGIEKEKLDFIFDSFKQVDSSIQKRFGGTGLGLAITKKLCDMLGIEIGVQSKLGQGTCFFLMLPFEQKQENKTQNQEIVLEKMITETVIPENKALKNNTFSLDASEVKASVLCLSDIQTAEKLKKYLTDFPLEVEPLNSVEECIEIAKEKIVWTIVVDPIDVFKTTTKLKSHPNLKDIPITVCSADMKKPNVHMEMLEYFAKPIEPQPLVDVMLRISKHVKENVLIVDDEPANCELYQQILIDVGYSPYVTYNGKEALHFLETQPCPQIIILDLLMPQMNGFEFLDKIRQHKLWRTIPVIVCTSKDLTAEEQQTLSKGTKTLLEKGKYTQKELSKNLESCLQNVCLGEVRSILVIDDHQMNLDLVSSIFGNHGYIVHKENSGPKGIDTAMKIRPDVILMDLAMPGMDGFKATRLLKENEKTADVTVIACSAFTTQDFKEKAYKVGCEGYITKPVEPNHLVQQVRKLILSSRIRRKIVAKQTHLAQEMQELESFASHQIKN